MNHPDIPEFLGKRETELSYEQVCLRALQSKRRQRLLLSACWPVRARILDLSVGLDIVVTLPCRDGWNSYHRVKWETKPVFQYGHIETETRMS